MSLLALLFALVCERGLTQLLHLREWRWLDAYFDWADRALAGRTGAPAVLAVRRTGMSVRRVRPWPS